MLPAGAGRGGLPESAAPVLFLRGHYPTGAGVGPSPGPSQPASGSPKHSSDLYTMVFSSTSKGERLCDRLASFMKVLIIRTDRLGDTILASPAWQALKDARPEAQVTLLTRRPYLPLFESDPQLSAVLSFPEEGRGAVDELARQLSALRFDALLVLYRQGSRAAGAKNLLAPQGGPSLEALVLVSPHPSGQAETVAVFPS